jgi:outer membrane protein TolC
MTKAIVSSVLVLSLGWFLPRAAAAKTYRLDELLDLAKKGNPGLAAGTQATAIIEAQLLEAKRSYLPTGELNSMVAPTPAIRCQDPANPDGDKDWRESHCVQTSFTYTTSSWADAITQIRGVFTRTEVKLVQPVYTFGKISAGVSAAESGIKASQSKQFGLAADLELNVRKAYWGAKLARAPCAPKSMPAFSRPSAVPIWHGAGCAPSSVPTRQRTSMWMKRTSRL